MKRGEVRWYTFAPPDKRRPVLILMRDSAIPYMNGITVAPFTTTRRVVPSQVFISADEGLPQDSAVNLYYMQTVPKSQLGHLITTLTADRMAEVEAAIRFALGFTELRGR
jgi:mRNA interferase MazF